MTNSKKIRERVRNFTSLTDFENKKSKIGEIKVFIYEDIKIRARFYNSEWYFSIVDVILALTNSSHPNRYWTDLKIKLSKNEGFLELYDKIVQLKLPSTDNKFYQTDCCDTKCLFRIIQSIPSPRAEPFKQWFSEIAYERLQEESQPSKSIDRAIKNYRKKGRSDDWIDHRLQAISARNDITDEWEERKVSSNSYHHITNAMSDEALGIRPKEHEKLKGLKKHHNLRDHMSEIELAITTLSERAATEIIRQRDTEGYEDTKTASVEGAKAAGKARSALEEALGKSIVSNSNFLRQTKNKHLNK